MFISKTQLAAISLSLCWFSIAFGMSASADAGTQTRTAQKTTATQTMKLSATPARYSELKTFCGSSRPTTSKRGKTTTYTCKPQPSGNSSSVQAKPDVQRSEIDCNYSESGGVITWLGCTCTSDDNGNCNNFISNCVEKGDDVSGNSGGASCGPSGG